MNKMNNVGNFVNPEEENKMNNTNNNNANNSINGLWEEITMEESVCFGNEMEDERATMCDEEWNFWIEEDRRRAEKNRKRDVERIREDLERIKFEDSVTLAEQRGVADDQILKTKADIDNYFMPADAKTQVNPEEEITVNENVNNVTETQVNPEEEITMKPKSNLEKLKDTVVSKVSEVYHEENNPKAYGLVDKANSIISSDLNIETYKKAVITLTEIEAALKETKSYTVKLSLEDVQSRLTNLTNYYEANAKASSTGTYEEKRLSGRESFVQGFVDLKDIGVEMASKAKASIDNIDEDNKYRQKGVEVTEKAKEKYNKVLSNVFNRLKL